MNISLLIKSVLFTFLLTLSSFIFSFKIFQSSRRMNEEKKEPTKEWRKWKSNRKTISPLHEVKANISIYHHCFFFFSFFGMKMVWWLISTSKGNDDNSKNEQKRKFNFFFLRLKHKPTEHQMPPNKLHQNLML